MAFPVANRIFTSFYDRTRSRCHKVKHTINALSIILFSSDCMYECNRPPSYPSFSISQLLSAESCSLFIFWILITWNAYRRDESILCIVQANDCVQTSQQWRRKNGSLLNPAAASFFPLMIVTSFNFFLCASVQACVFAYFNGLQPVLCETSISHECMPFPLRSYFHSHINRLSFIFDTFNWWRFVR